MEDKKKKKGLKIKCYKEGCFRVRKYNGINLNKTTCTHCGQTLYFPKCIIDTKEYNLRKKAQDKIILEIKKEFGID